MAEPRPDLDPVTTAYHELRGPLGLIAMAARSAAEGCPDDDLRRRCETIERAATRMLRTTRQVFDFAHANAAQGGESSGGYSPADAVAEIVGDLREFGVAVELDVASDLRTLFAEGDRAQFEALVQSLISNAIDHADEGATVKVSMDAVERTLSLIVSNPIATERVHRGLGIGMLLCGRVVEKLGGDMRTETDEDEFRTLINLPVA